MLKKLTALGFAAAMFAVTTADAALLSRLGGKAYYDDVTNLTWLTDANHPKTVGNSLTGQLNWWDATDFASALVIDGIADWHLPSASKLSDFILQSSGAIVGLWDLANLPDWSRTPFKNIDFELNIDRRYWASDGVSSFGPSDSVTDCVREAFGGDFCQLTTFSYITIAPMVRQYLRSDTVNRSDGSVTVQYEIVKPFLTATAIGENGGGVALGGAYVPEYLAGAWPVHDGDVGLLHPVPLPTTVLLLCPALASLGLMRRHAI